MAKDVASKITNGYLETFYTIPAVSSSVWVDLDMTDDGSTLIIQVNQDQGLLFLQTVLVTSTLFNVYSGFSPLTLIVSPETPRLPTGELALSDEDFLRNATSIVALIPTCALVCEDQVPGLPAFSQRGTFDTLDKACNNTLVTFDGFVTCAQSSSLCEADDVSSANSFKQVHFCMFSIHAASSNNFRYIAVNNTITFKFVPPPGYSLTSFDYTVTDLNSQVIAKSKRSARADNSQNSLGTVTITLTSCAPLNVQMKYGLCDGALIENNQCQGTVTGHVKNQDIDPTKIKGTGFYGQNCGQSIAPTVSVVSNDQGNSVAIISGSCAAVVAVLLIVFIAVLRKQKREKEEVIKSVSVDMSSEPVQQVSVQVSEKGTPLFGALGCCAPNCSKGENGGPLSFDVSTLEVQRREDIAQWTVHDVANWVYINGGGDLAARKVQEEEIDGKALLLVNVQEFVQFVAVDDQLAFGKLLLEVQRGGEIPPAWKP
ncbi:hypothetical protein BCR33DRAFT_740854 [Rhizoclosmatium globosum]|uniref:Uncharacterized protein n=1 Tax=Rhizoclosmatium globosum TaxID=329046 RepID=A0A1Y2BXP4_9FUNG|nr:hypothetical protein BCR33DRAFT_740854 [Rhizoclosmatium globosum]|eukprot:ORY39523.1 hypothetical protein BCR33DRAFT_740854 [Rhizoclosmatium globosum]